MIIKVERSGGLTGLPINNEIDSKDLPLELLTKVERIMTTSKLSSVRKYTPDGAADYFTYKISIINGSIHRVIECNQFNIQDDLKSVVKYIERNSTKDRSYK